jgi:hypothetical protein
VSEIQDTSANSKLKIILAGLLATLASVSVAVFLYFSLACPCERTPGAYLFGDVVDEAITDWSFANDVPLCQIQVWAGVRPHAVNLNCMATPEGELFLSCGNCVNKYWAGEVGDDEQGRLRLNGTVYPVKLRRVLDDRVLDQAWDARVTKLQVHAGPLNPAPAPDAQRGEGWASFQVTSSI